MSVRSTKVAAFLVVAVILLCAAAVVVSAGCTRVGAICKDGWISEATGPGACSWHGGVAKWRVQPDVTVHVWPSTVHKLVTTDLRLLKSFRKPEAVAA